MRLTSKKSLEIATEFEAQLDTREFVVIVTGEKEESIVTAGFSGTGKPLYLSYEPEATASQILEAFQRGQALAAEMREKEAKHMIDKINEETQKAEKKAARGF